MKSKFDLKPFVTSLPDNPMVESLVKFLDESNELNIDDMYVKRAGKEVDISIKDGEERTFVGYASTRDLDRDNEIVIPDGIDLTHFKMAPSLIWAHNWTDLPIGSDREIASDGYGLLAKSEMAEYSFADDVWSLVQGNHLKTSSIGFAPLQVLRQGTKDFGVMVDGLVKKWDEFTIKAADRTSAIIPKSLLLEHSLTGVAANIFSLIGDVSEKSAKRFGITVKEPDIVVPPEPEVITVSPERVAKAKGFTVYRKAKKVPTKSAGFILAASPAVGQAVKDAIAIRSGKVSV